MGGLAVANGWLANDWLLAIAVALSFSFVLASPFNRAADFLFDSVRSRLERCETVERHHEEKPHEPGGWKIGILGMGRVGTGTYDYFTDQLGPVVLDLDFSAETVDEHLAADRQVALADVTDPDFWRKFPDIEHSIELLILTLPVLESQLYAAKKARECGFDGEIAAVAQYDDEVEILREAGVATSYNVFNEAGIGLASHISNTLDMSAFTPPNDAA